ncbi:hypothetical protein ACFQ3S_02750 [Mucilaginibacter terrae]|uniref:hypothetical protein n=1 Tax=Mucilaginibacter terrae TaxID=1955052 RepID=UPI00363D579B
MPDKKISELPVVPSSLTGDDVGVLVRNNTDYQFSFDKLRDYVAANTSSGNQIFFVTNIPQNTEYKDLDIAINTFSGAFYQKRNGGWSQVFTLPPNAPAGNSITYGFGEPDAASGQIDDTYIDTANGIFYQKNVGGWEMVFSMLDGPAGGPGPKGDTGAPGVNGKTVLNGIINPSNQTVGTNGDFYINTTTWIIYGPKINGDWGTGKYMTQDIAELGNLSDLSTTDKSNLIAAINEVLSKTAAPAWKVYGSVPFGKYSNNMTVPAAANAYMQFKEAYQNVNAPVYTLPTAAQVVTAKINATQAVQPTANIEVGQVVDFNINPQFNNNSAGGLADTNPLLITKKIGNAAAIQIGNTDPTDHTAVTTTAEAISFTSAYNYKSAPIKTNDAGEPDNRGQFGDGTVSSTTTITPRYKVFYGALPDTAALSSDSLRGVSGGGSVNFIWENGSIPISLNTGTTHKRFFVAVRNGIGRSLTVAKDVQTNGDVKSIYLAGKQTFNLKNGGTGDVSYDVYLYEQAVPYGDPHTHELTI